MALVKCLECEREVSSFAPQCPGCGFPMTDFRMPEPVERADHAAPAREFPPEGLDLGWSPAEPAPARTSSIPGVVCGEGWRWAVRGLGVLLVGMIAQLAGWLLNLCAMSLKHEPDLGCLLVILAGFCLAAFGKLVGLAAPIGLAARLLVVGSLATEVFGGLLIRLMVTGAAIVPQLPWMPAELEPEGWSPMSVEAMGWCQLGGIGLLMAALFLIGKRMDRPEFTRGVVRYVIFCVASLGFCVLLPWFIMSSFMAMAAGLSSFAVVLGALMILDFLVVVIGNFLVVSKARQAAARTLARARLQARS